VEKNNLDFMPRTLLQWTQVASLIIGIAIVIGGIFNKLDNRLTNFNERITHIEYKIGIKK